MIRNPRTMRLRMHQDYYELIQQFGGLSKVANTMVELVYMGIIDPREMTRCPEPDKTCIGCSVTITNPHYEELVAEYGMSSPRVSLRRYLYYFVEAELYDTYSAYFTSEAEREEQTKQLTLSALLRRKH